MGPKSVFVEMKNWTFHSKYNNLELYILLIKPLKSLFHNVGSKTDKLGFCTCFGNVPISRVQKWKICRLPPKHHFFRGAGAGGRMWTSWSRHTLLWFLEDLRLDAGSRHFVGRFKRLCRPDPHPDPNFSDVTQMQFHLNTLLENHDFQWFSWFHV